MDSLKDLAQVSLSHTMRVCLVIWKTSAAAALRDRLRRLPSVRLAPKRRVPRAYEGGGGYAPEYRFPRDGGLLLMYVQLLLAVVHGHSALPVAYPYLDNYGFRDFIRMTCLGVGGGGWGVLMLTLT